MKSILKSIFIKFLQLILSQRKFEYFLFKDKCKKVRKHGPQALDIFSKIAESLNVEYSLMYGTLLGSYREHCFIKHDDDIDIAVERSCISMNLISSMINCGFVLYHALVTEDKTRMHVAFMYKGVKFDLYSFIVDPKSKTATSCVPRPVDGDWSKSKLMGQYRVLNMTFPYKGFVITHFEKAYVKIWANSAEVLTINYGSNFMTPIKGAKAKNNDNIYFDRLQERSFRIISLDQLGDYLQKI